MSALVEQRHRWLIIWRLPSGTEHPCLESLATNRADAVAAAARLAARTATEPDLGAPVGVVRAVITWRPDQVEPLAVATAGGR